MVENTITGNVKIVAMMTNLGQALQDVQAIQDELSRMMIQDVPPPGSVPALDQNFRAWLKQSVYDTGRTVTDFCNETGLSRQLTNAHSQSFDPSMGNFMLVCEVLSIWQGLPLENVVMTAIRTTKAYKSSVSRLPQTSNGST